MLGYLDFIVPMVRRDELTPEEKKEELMVYIKVRQYGCSIHIIIIELPFDLARGKNEHGKGGNDR